MVDVAGRAMAVANITAVQAGLLYTLEPDSKAGSALWSSSAVETLYSSLKARKR